MTTEQPVDRTICACCKRPLTFINNCGTCPAVFCQEIACIKSHICTDRIEKRMKKKAAEASATEGSNAA